MERLLGALRSILDKPVIDETGIRGTYDLKFPWGEHGVKSVRRAMLDRFGLRRARTARSRPGDPLSLVK